MHDDNDNALSSSELPMYGLQATTSDGLLPLDRFSALHLQHILAHPPDSVLFPFLHGLEGDNHAQNTFFSSSSSASAAFSNDSNPSTGGSPQRSRPKGPHVPRYRGLVWVVCEDDLAAEPTRYARELGVLRRKRDGGFGDAVGLATPGLDGGDSSGGSSEYDDDEDDEDDEDFDVDADVDVHAHAEEGTCRCIEVISVVPPDAMDVDGLDVNAVVRVEEGDEKHMHPVVQRPLPIQTTNLPSSFSSTSTGLSTSDSDRSSFFSPALGDTATPNPPSPTPTPTAPNTSANSGSNGRRKSSPKPKSIPAQPDLTLLTCTFRPSEILRHTAAHNAVNVTTEDDGQWEFVPARVPDGISLRNFGIQVPIYATLSDIVVYSPKGPTANAHALARRLRAAVHRKWLERVQRLGGLPDGSTTHPDLLNYNVAVLDATARDIATAAPHLLMRLAAPAPGHTDGTDGHVVDMAIEETNNRARAGADMEVDIVDDMEMDCAPGVDGAGEGKLVEGKSPRLRTPNTVDFAQREKEEMRDLTRASEIIRLESPLSSTTTTVNLVTNTDMHSTATPHNMSSTSNGLPHPAHTWEPLVGQVFLGNADDVPLAPDTPNHLRPPLGIPSVDGSAHAHAATKPGQEDPEDPFTYRATNDPKRGLGYDICIECHDLAPFPSTAHLRAAEEHLAMLDALWIRRVQEQAHEKDAAGSKVPPRPPPNANAVIHLPFPSSPPNSQTSLSALIPVIRFLEKWLTPVAPPPPSSPPPPPVQPQVATTGTAAANSASARRWSSVTALMPHFPSFPGSGSSPSVSTTTSSNTDANTNAQATTTTTPGSCSNAQPPARTRSFTSPAGNTPPHAPPPRTRPLKVLLYSADGYTESSVPALCLLMAVRGCTLPEAYLELQVARRRSFFVYHADIPIMRRVEARMREDAERARAERERVQREMRAREALEQGAADAEAGVNGNGKRVATAPTPPARQGWGSVMGGTWRSPPVPKGPAPAPTAAPTPPPPAVHGRPAAKSISFARPPQIAQGQVRSQPVVVPSQQQGMQPQNYTQGTTVIALPPAPAPTPTRTRPRANTSPWLPSVFGDHQSWFNDPRFDGSFPSRVLPFLYLGNLNHASNAYMLHALGITHVVSVGECALVPPPHHAALMAHNTHHGQAAYHSSSPFQHPGPGAHYVPGRAPGQGSLWFEEREGRIKVLDIKGVCDDGIDTLEPQLEPICDWIDQARAEGGQVLVHCRVGVSRSATVTIAYVMKHLGLPLVDAYLIVRSRRLSVLIQPNMRLLYNLCGWEIKLAKARAGDDEERMRKELARTLSWPYLAKEVHALNEKYLH